MTNAVMKKGARPATCTTKNGSKQSALTCCEIRIEECAEGCKIYCTCDNQAAYTKLQNLCRELECCSCCVQCTRDGEMCCECSFNCCDCTCNMLTNGVCICCTTNDEMYLKMIQAMCCCLGDCGECGCTMTVCIDNQAVCCRNC